jgi:hypothetical protein
MDKSTNSEKTPDKVKWGLLGKYLGGLILIYVVIAAFIPLSDNEEYIRCQYSRPYRWVDPGDRAKHRVCERYPFSTLFFKRINLVHRMNTDAAQTKEDAESRQRIKCTQWTERFSEDCKRWRNSR